MILDLGRWLPRRPGVLAAVVVAIAATSTLDLGPTALAELLVPRTRVAAEGSGVTRILWPRRAWDVR